MSRLLVRKIFGWIFILKAAFTRPLFLSILLCALFTLPSTACAVTEAWVNSTRSSIRALDSARTTSVKEMEQTSLSEQEAADYRNFVVYLNTRITTYCTELYQSGATAELSDLPCPSAATLAALQKETKSENGKTIMASTRVGASRTRAETTKDLHGSFLEALGEFDQMLLKEEEKVSARVPRQRESGETGQSGSGAGSGAAGRGGENGSGETSSGSGQDNGTENGSAAEGETGETNGNMGRGGDPGAMGRGGAPDETHSRSAKAGAPGGTLPPPEDDDIVARQLREAAEKETDPELKKKLWEEYWKYKGVTK